MRRRSSAPSTPPGGMPPARRSTSRIPRDDALGGTRLAVAEFRQSFNTQVLHFPVRIQFGASSRCASSLSLARALNSCDFDPRGDSQFGRDFLVRIAFDIVQQEDRAAPGDSLDAAASMDAASSRVRCHVPRPRFPRYRSDPRQAPGAAQRVQRPVDRDPVRPGAELRLSTMDGRARKIWIQTSCAMSSARSGSPARRRTTASMCGACCDHRDRNARSSPSIARCIVRKSVAMAFAVLVTSAGRVVAIPPRFPPPASEWRRHFGAR